MDRYRLAAVKLGGKDLTESGNLLYEGERTEVVDWLRAHGWAVTAATSADDLMAASNRAVPAGLDAAVPESVFVEGRT
jgi:O-methyltransferase involved in polyketide biosynthesis